LKQIEQLAALQKIDDEIMQLNAFLKNAPLELERMQIRSSELRDAVKEMNEKIVQIVSQRNQLDKDIEDAGLKIKKSKNRLMMVSNSKEHQAMMREIDNLEKMNRNREEEKVSVMEEVARQEKFLTEVQKELADLQQEISQKKKQINQKLQSSQERLKTLQGQRGEAEEVIPKPILSRYQFIRARLSQPVVVSVDRGICKGCHISIPPQTYNVLQKGEQILSCPNCHRIIYWAGHFAKDESEG
jgi:predicted  nucleic acid-binding Zn-ribbon protein